MVIAIDLGGSKYFTGMMTENGKLNQVSKQVFDTRLGFSQFFQKVKPEIWQLIESGGKSNIRGIGISVPALADANAGILSFAPYCNWKNISVREIFENEFGVPVFIENDVNACAIGEKKFGACCEIQHFIWITLSNGIGSAVVFDGKLYHGSAGFSGELGHIVVEPDGPACGCGNHGCLEAVASATALARDVLEQIKQQPELAQKFPNLSRREIVIRIFKLARAQDEFCCAILQKVSRYIGAALASAVNMLNPETVVFGGGMSLSLDLLLPEIKNVMQKRVMPPLYQNLSIIPTSLGEYAALIGAGCLVPE